MVVDMAVTDIQDPVQEKQEARLVDFVFVFLQHKRVDMRSVVFQNSGENAVVADLKPDVAGRLAFKDTSENFLQTGLDVWSLCTVNGIFADESVEKFKHGLDGSFFCRQCDGFGVW